MKRYDYICPKCSERQETTSPQRPFCSCGAMMRRDYRSVNVAYHPTKGSAT